MRMDIKEIFSKNFATLRKTYNLTQAEFAEKINYSDKAVSKWERGESLPDLEVTKQIADFFGVTVDYLLTEHSEQVKAKYNIPVKRFLICGLSTGLAWLIATLCFAFIQLLIPTATKTWLSFVIAVPVTMIILLVLTSVWGKTLTNMFITSGLVWSVIATLYIVLINTLASPPPSLWLLWLIGIPLQVLVILWFTYKKIK